MRDRLSRAIYSLRLKQSIINFKIGENQQNTVHFRQLKFSALIIFPHGPAILGNLGCGLNNNGRWKCDSFSSPHPHHPRKKKNDTIWSGGGVCLPCHTGVNQKLVTLGFSNASHLTSLRVCFCFIFVGKMKNDFFCFYSSRASSQFINIIKYTVVLICGMVREKGKK